VFKLAAFYSVYFFITATGAITNPSGVTVIELIYITFPSTITFPLPVISASA
jgi:hypothetical protein